MTSRWAGRWIAPEARGLDPLTSGLHGGPRDGVFSRSLFRRAFDLGEVPAHASAGLTADSRYVLWVNGREVGRGPARS
jgi:alpha-L-rhamnosidase